MPDYRLLLSRQAHKFITGLDKPQARRIVNGLGDLSNYPLFTDHHDLAKLKGRKGYYRMRIGGIRIIFRVFEDEKEIYIEKIGYRENIYK